MMDIFPKEFGAWNYAKIIEKKRVMKPFLNSIVMPPSGRIRGTDFAITGVYFDGSSSTY